MKNKQQRIQELFKACLSLSEEQRKLRLAETPSDIRNAVIELLALFEACKELSTDEREQRLAEADSELRDEVLEVLAEHDAKKERWRKIEELFNACLGLSEEEQRKLLEDAGEIGEIVAKMLIQDAAHDSDITNIIRQNIRPEQPERPEPPKKLGPYLILGPLGSGGQGDIYLATHEDPEIQSRVAIKVLRPGRISAETMARFRRERHILSGFDHPNIARFIDAGTTEDGLLYQVMEVVEGQPIDVYCDQHKLSTDQRIDLFCQAAAAVQAAHQRLVIHRDIKPGNLLVTEEGVPKLLDFGIAKLLDASEPMAETMTKVPLLTPEVASPEQVLGLELTTATDIYSLGLLLYRLLTGGPAHIFANSSPAELVRVVSKVQPALVSEASGRRELRGDVDSIIAKSLHKDVGQRYNSVEQLLGDLKRYRSGLPVLAREAGLGYRVGKFLRRYWRPLAFFGAVAATLLVLGIAFSLRLQEERDRALAVQQFIREIFDAGNPNAAQGEEIRVSSLLPNAVSQLSTLDQQPQVQADLATLIGSLYATLGRHDEGRDLLQKAVAWNRLRSDSAAKADLANSLHSLGHLLLEQGKLEDSENKLQEALALRLDLFGEHHPAAAETRFRLAELAYTQGNQGVASSEIQKVLNLRLSLLEGRPPSEQDALELARTLDLVATIALDEDLEAAVSKWEESLKWLDVAKVKDHQLRAAILSNYSIGLSRLDRLPEAIEAVREAMRIDELLLGPSNMRLAIRQMVHGGLLRHNGQPQDSVDSCEESRRMITDLSNEQNYNLIQVHTCLARAHKDLEQYSAAEEAYREALRIAEWHIAERGEPESLKRRLVCALGNLLRDQDRPQDAEPILRQCVELARQYRPEADTTRRAECALGRALLATGNNQQGEPLLSNCSE